MSIRVVLRDGVFHPIDPIPSDWPEGIEARVDAPGAAQAAGAIGPWRAEIEALAAEVGIHDLGPILSALEKADREARDPSP